MELSKRQRLMQRWSALELERSSWLDHWKDVSEYLLPRSGRFFHTDRNKGQKKHNLIYDSTGTRSLRILAAGMMSGVTSPARPWFRLTIPDKALAEYAPVKVWLDDVATLMREIFAKSNTYRALHSMYEELGAFGTAANFIEDDFDSVIHMHPLTIGEYAISTNGKGQVNTLFRKFDMTVAQLVDQFGYENCSKRVQELYNGHNLEAWIPVVHSVYERNKRDVTKRDAKNMRYASCYFEYGHDETGSQFLREAGYNRFPAICPRWSATGGDVYGNSPGMEALGDLKQLQHEQLRKAQGIDYKSKPPMTAPATAKHRDIDLLPGGVSFVDSTGAGGGLRTAFEVNLDLSHLLADIQDVRTRINQTFYADLFLMIANDQRSNITAREIAERHEEKLLMLGPVLERLHDEMLSPLIDITFDKIVKAGILPTPPQELQGMDVSVEFVSMLAQAQRAVGTGAVDRLLGTVGSIAQFKPEVLDKIDGDQIVDAYADMLGVDPSLIVADDKVAMIRDQRAQQQAAMQRAAAMPQMAQATKTLSEADTEGKNALTDVVSMFSGYGT
jgi:hypothetical protein